MINLKQFAFNPLQVNSWLIYEENGAGILIDPSAHTAQEFLQLDNYIHAHAISLESVINTHGHFDHVFGAGQICKEYGARFLIHEGDAALLKFAEHQAAIFGFSFVIPVPDPDGFLSDGQEIRAGSICLKVIHVPGHSPGCVAFHESTLGWLFSGDTLFEGSIGRTDLPGGDLDQILESIRSRLFILPDPTEVLPGHGPVSTIGREKRTNPFVGE